MAEMNQAQREEELARREALLAQREAQLEKEQAELAAAKAQSAERKKTLLDNNDPNFVNPKEKLYDKFPLTVHQMDIIIGVLFALIALERAGWGRVLARSRVISRVYMVLMIPLSWLLFAIPSVSRIGVYLGRLFPLVSRGIAVNAGDWLQYGKQYWWLLVLGIVFSTPGPEKLWNRIRGTWLGTVILAVLFWACVYCMSVATNDPFMYFSF